MRKYIALGPLTLFYLLPILLNILFGTLEDILALLFALYLKLLSLNLLCLSKFLIPFLLLQDALRHLRCRLSCRFSCRLCCSLWCRFLCSWFRCHFSNTWLYNNGQYNAFTEDEMFSISQFVEFFLMRLGWIHAEKWPHQWAASTLLCTTLCNATN